MFSNDFISAFNILSISAMSFFRVVFLPYPSAILEGIDTADLLICGVRPYLSSFGNFAVILYIFKQNSFDLP